MRLSGWGSSRLRSHRLRLRVVTGLVSGVVLLCVAPSVLATADAPKAAPRKESYEELLSEAEPVADLAQLIDPLFSTCEASDALDQRQCEGARSFLERDARGKIYVAYGDSAALSVNPYDAAMKEVDLDVQGCLACVHPLKLGDGKGGLVSRFFTTKVPRAIKGGRAIGLDVATLQLSMATPEREAKWKRQEKRVVPRLRTQFVFKLGPTWSSGSFSGVGFVPLGYRVVDVCTGEVLATSPATPSAGGEAPKTKVSTPVALQAGDAVACPAPGEDLSPEERAARDEIAKLPPHLSREQIEHTMGEVQEGVHDCHVEFEESGTVNLRIVVEGPTGRVKEVQVYPPFDKTPAGLCVRAALKNARFGKTRAATQEFKLPVYLR